MRIVRTEELARHARAGHDLIPLHVWDAVDDGRGTAIRHAEPEELLEPGDGVRLRGKSPLHNDWPRREYSKIELRVAADDGHNFGVRLSDADLVIDYDPRNDPDGVGFAALVDFLGAEFLATCPVVLTGGGGRHYYLRRPPEECKLRSHLEDLFGRGVEFKTRGAQVVAAGSRHPNGGFYAWDDFSPEEPPEVPVDLLALLVKPAAKSSTSPGTLSPEELARLLDALDPSDFQEHDAWLRVGMASHHATNGLGVEEFVTWSAGDPDYADHGALIRERWDSWAAGPGDVAVTVNTLLHLARERGADVDWYTLRLFPAIPEGLPPEPEPGAALPEPTGPAAPLERLSRRFAVVPEGSSTFVYRVADGVPQRMRVGAFHDLLANEFFENEDGNRMPISKAWMASRRRRTFRGVEFAPEGGREGFLNTWTGWGVEPDGDASWSYLYELIHDVICSGESEWSSYVLDWCATMIQHPGAPIDVAMCLRGPKGTGKSTLGRVLKEIAGHHGFALSHGLARQFNAHLREIVFLLADEAFFAGDKRAESQLKNMITEPEIMYEPKGVDAAMARNCLHILMCSNEAWLAPATLDERRFAVFEVTERRDRDWWNALYEQKLSGEMARGFLAHLLEREVKRHPRECIPSTGALASQKLASLPPIDMAWFDILRGGRLPAELQEDGSEPVAWCDGPVTISVDTLQALIARHDRGPGAERRRTTELGVRLKVLIPRLRKRRTRQGGDRVYLYDLPSLDDCRAHFEKLLDHEIDWDES